MSMSKKAPTDLDASAPILGPQPAPVETDETECPEVGECPTATVQDPPEARDRNTDTPLVHITTDRPPHADRTHCGVECGEATPDLMDLNAGDADEWVVEHLGRQGRVEVCVSCARTYLGTEPAGEGGVSWRHRLAAVVVYGRDTHNHVPTRQTGEDPRQ